MGTSSGDAAGSTGGAAGTAGGAAGSTGGAAGSTSSGGAAISIGGAAGSTSSGGAAGSTGGAAVSTGGAAGSTSSVGAAGSTGGAAGNTAIGTSSGGAATMLPALPESTIAPDSKPCIMSPHVVNALSQSFKMDNATVGDVTNTFSSIIERLFLHCGAGDTFSIKIDFTLDMNMDGGDSFEHGHISHSHSIK